MIKSKGVGAIFLLGRGVIKRWLLLTPHYKFDTNYNKITVEVVFVTLFQTISTLSEKLLHESSQSQISFKRSWSHTKVPLNLCVLKKMDHTFSVSVSCPWLILRAFGSKSSLHPSMVHLPKLRPTTQRAGFCLGSTPGREARAQPIRVQSCTSR